MSAVTTYGPTMLAAFMGSAVEFVEALTIVLAVGIVRGWRSALAGAGVGLIALLLLVLIFGASLSAVPLPIFQGVVGTLLLLFGLRWLRKAILRSAGVIDLHDETAAFAEETAALRRGVRTMAFGIDTVAFLTSLKAVVLEGVEVAFIVIAIGAGGTLLVPAAVGAGVALLLVVALGIVLRRPLSAIPENTLKFGVGILLSAFGCFWVVEGLGFGWSTGDAAILMLILFFAVEGLVLVMATRRLRQARAQRPEPQHSAGGAGLPVASGFVAVAAREIWGLFVDDGWLAAGVLTILVGAFTVVQMAGVVWTGANVLLVAALAMTLALSALRRATQRIN